MSDRRSRHHTVTDVMSGLVVDVAIAGGVEAGDTFELNGHLFTVETVTAAANPNYHDAIVRHENGRRLAVRVWVHS